ncbi:arylformamidase [Hazenella sp. IB182357]|uniref:Kynurenine formamidase n=1 Tax=Polycladospora coralii TaxID=2771432 RepID=A0A926NA70_9BACL|nr:arylformamidase [Polycladospora coralii]MBD1373086.1 arylformamidase [Polycladospora coralii]MBS7529568.1 arylformamidase [Polycladospora coralii]
MKIIDISQPLLEQIPVWPGDTPLTYDLAVTKEQSGSVNVGRIQMSVHTGTHVDAPYHFDVNGDQVNQLDLKIFMGQVRVIHLPNRMSIGASDFEGISLEGVKRLIIRTDSWQDPTRFPETCTYLRPDLVPLLAKKGIQLIGLDVPSVDPLDSKELPTHHALADAGIYILEGAVLSHVEEGNYELIALPLPIVGGDGSPVRAVLRTLSEASY